LVRLLEIVGEAAPQFRRRRAIAMRPSLAPDRLIDGYETVDSNIVWAIVTRDLPGLIAEVGNALADES
jgi:uncharacterized protein with HEPN domain